MSASTPRVAVVTDSTAALPTALTGGLTVVPLTIVIDGKEGREGVDVTPAEVADALTANRPVSTSRPAPWMFVAEYERLLGMGYEAVLSMHLSAKLSGTWESAALAAADFEGCVEVIDSGAAGMGLGFPVVAAAAAAARGADLAGVRAAAEAAIERTVTLFYVDTLEFMRRGGRIGATQAAVGTALSVKPILGMRDGAVVPLEKVRTSGKAIARVVERAAEAVGGSTVDIAVQHAAAAERADALADALTARLPVRERYVGEVGAVLAAHSGPGLVCAVLLRVPDPVAD
jgi:DegV family protein with EDD domain